MNLHFIVSSIDLKSLRDTNARAVEVSLWNCESPTGKQKKDGLKHAPDRPKINVYKMKRYLLNGLFDGEFRA